MTRSSTKSAPGTGVVLWDRPPPAARDRRTRLDRADIARVAFDVAESENLQAVSVKRVAGRLGVPAVRMETYLLDRADLLDLMVEVALGEIELPADSGAGDWQEQLRAIALGTRAVVARHPWLSGLLGLRAASGPNGLRFTERALRAMDGIGLEIGAMADCVHALLAYVCGSVRPDALAASAPAQRAPEVLAGYLANAVTPDSLPMTSRLLGSPAARSGDEAFEIGLSYLLSGIAATVPAS